MSGEKYTTISAVPPLVKGLVKSTQSVVFESAAVQAFQVTATEQLQQQWKKKRTFSDTAPNTLILSSALELRFRKLKFLTPEQVFKVQAKVQTEAFEVRRDHQQQQCDGVHEQTSVTSTSTVAAPAPTTPLSLLDSLLDSETSSEEEHKEGYGEDPSSQVRNEVLTYFGEKPLPKEEIHYIGGRLMRMDIPHWPGNKVLLMHSWHPNTI